MNNITSFTLAQYAEIIELALSHGKKPGDSMQEEFDFVCKKYNIKSHVTELTKTELIREYESHGKKVADGLEDLKPQGDSNV